MPVHTFSEKNVQFTQDFLMNDRRSGHIIDHPVDQFDTAFIRQGIVIVQRVFALPFFAQHIFLFNSIKACRFLQPVRISGTVILPVQTPSIESLISVLTEAFCVSR